MDNLAVITGGSKGIGKSTLIKFDSEGWETISLSRNNPEISNSHYCKIDLSSGNIKEKLNLEITPYLKNKKKICIVHNACAYFSGSTENTSTEDLNQSWIVNVVSSVVINKIIIPYMNPGSSIIYIGSTLSEMAIKNSLPYVVTKHAVIGLMRSTCQDLGEKSIHTCGICPGFTETETLNKHLKESNRSIDQVAQQVLMKRIIKPEEISSFIFYCANTPIINGAVLHANLGSVNR